MGPIGIFDSGYGGLTVFKEIQKKLPEYDYLYLGDNARVPYGTRSYKSVYEYTKQCVYKLFEMGSPLVILACNTASAKALKTIQQKDLIKDEPNKRVLGVIRPTTEVIGEISKTKHIGIFATPGTVKSNSYPIEIQRFFPDIQVFQEACPMWVPIVENNMIDHAGSALFVKENIDTLLAQSSQIDTFILACTHYPLLTSVIQRFTPPHISIVSQGEIVASSLKNYLNKHKEINDRCTKNASVSFFTTESVEEFNEKGTLFFGQNIQAIQLDLTI